MDEWARAWPTELGHYWFYGWCSRPYSDVPEMILVEVTRTTYSVAYFGNGRFISRIAEGATGVWKKAVLPEPPEMKRPIILSGKPFDWKAGSKAMLNAVDESGQIDWKAAFSADPGVKACPGCGIYLWREGERVECPSCHTEFELSK